MEEFNLFFPLIVKELNIKQFSEVDKVTSDGMEGKVEVNGKDNLGGAGAFESFGIIGVFTMYDTALTALGEGRIKSFLPHVKNS
jgi:hypothetical protein